ncbi:hypothetical protein ACFV4Q_20640 [Streptomyces nojiriensis]|uniref:hypothetical protein n=1 Tax=Streptomyces nojiriensis TaxID=66374 RepID=UPI00365D12FE
MTVETDADTPVHAAYEALVVQRDPTSWATAFTVHTDDGDVVVNLNPRHTGPPKMSGPWPLTAYPGPPRAPARPTSRAGARSRPAAQARPASREQQDGATRSVRPLRPRLTVGELSTQEVPPPRPRRGRGGGSPSKAGHFEAGARHLDGLQLPGKGAPMPTLIQGSYALRIEPTGGLSLLDWWLREVPAGCARR